MRTPTRISNAFIKRAGRLTRPLLVATLAAGLMVAGSSAARAQSITDVDTARDMAMFDWENGETRPAPNQVRNDVLKTTLTHSATRISIRVKYSELRRLGEQQGQYVQVVTNEGVRRNIGVSAEWGDWAGYAEMTRGRDESEVRCAIRHSIDYTRNVIAVSFPRQCASSPRWVKFRVVGQRMGETGVYLDDALRDEPFLGDNPAQSRRVYRASSL
jgi:hypothetical protein